MGIVILLPHGLERRVFAPWYKMEGHLSAVFPAGDLPVSIEGPTFQGKEFINGLGSWPPS